MGLKRIVRKFIPAPVLSVYHFLLALLAAMLYHYPSKDLVVIGVTGTKGKSTVSNLITQLLDALGATTGLTSTINFKISDKEWLNDKKMTMLGRFATQKLLRKMVQADCHYAVIETSSEGIKQWRHRGIMYDVVVFTNLTPEHIESHGSFAKYRAAKESLFMHLSHGKNKTLQDKKIPKIIIANSDDKETERLIKFKSDKLIQYGMSNVADVISSDIKTTATGISMRINGEIVSLPLLGRFNASNFIAAAATVAALGFGLDAILNAAKKIKALPGRQEKIDCGQSFTIIVDYAYEPESQLKLYELIAEIPHEKVLHVTGSTGGGRDKKRRPELGMIAGHNADIVIVTDEDPYDEDPMTIINQVAAGSRKAGKLANKDLLLIPDRREAIYQALTLARKNDLVLITGKGSEQAMCIANGKKIPWDDRNIVRDFFNK